MHGRFPSVKRKDDRMKKPARIIIVVVLLAVVGTVIWYFTEQNGQDKNIIAASGTIESTEISISSQTAGKIKRVAVQEGQKVKKDEVVAEIDDALLQDQVKQAQAGVDAAQAAVESAEDGTDAEKKAANAQLRQAEAVLSMAQIQASYAKITVAQDGEILDVPIDEGEDATPGTVIAVLGDLKDLKVDIYVPENQLGLVKLGQKADMSVDSFPSTIFKGKVSKIASEPEFTPTSVQTKDQRLKTVYKVTVSAQNVENKLKPGMPVDVEIRFH